MGTHLSCRHHFSTKGVKSESLLLSRAVEKLPHLPPLPLLYRPMSLSGSTIGLFKPNKVIVFSQWTSMLDLIEIPLSLDGIKYIRLDGTMSVSTRDKAVQDFSSRLDVNVMIMSLKAAAVGLNLVAANHVVILDLWWNPTLEEQAIDRAHRIGQTREVTIHRLTIAGTVEDRILKLQEKKLNIVNRTLSGSCETLWQTTNLTSDDLCFLFGN